jgi:hypothetical protein
VVRQTSDCDQLYLLAQISYTPTSKIDNYRLDVLINPVSLFYNRALVARAETFLH